MLLQLLPDQAAKYWEQVKFAIESAAPPTVDVSGKMNRILESLLGGDMLAWVSVDDETKGIVAIITTTFVTDIASDETNLLLYSVYGTADMIGRKNWLGGFKTLVKFARDKGCKKIIAYTKDDNIKRLAEYFGGDTSWSLISIEVKK